MSKKDQYWGLLVTIKELNSKIDQFARENAALREEVATWRTIASAYNQLIQNAVSKSARKEAQP